MSNGGDEELDHALRLVELLGRAGCDAVSDDSINRHLVEFHERHGDAIERRGDSIAFENTEWVARERSRQSRKFFPIAVAKPKFIKASFIRLYPFLKEESCKVELIIFFSTNPKTPVGYRFEAGHRGNEDVHGYLHVQMTDRFKKGEDGWIDLMIPCPLRKECPAPPLPAAIPYAGLYCALLSLSGHSRDGKKGLIERIREAERFFKGSDFCQFVEKTHKKLEALLGREGDIL
jgi:hypothetical protein